jgi:hypothetical protein
LFSAETTPEVLSEGSVRVEHIEDLLGLARSSRMPTNLMEKLVGHQDMLRRRN